jgi:hypothetical protein
MDGKQTAAPKKREHKPENPFSIIFTLGRQFAKEGIEGGIQIRSSLFILNQNKKVCIRRPKAAVWKPYR